MKGWLPLWAVPFAAVMIVGCPSPVTYPDGPAGTIAISGANPTARTTLYGQNYWCWNNGQVAGTQTQIAALHLDVFRAGGYNNDSQTSSRFDPFDYTQIDTYISYCRSIDAEPIVQVSLLKNIQGNQATAQDAADIVSYCNVTKGYAVKYWEIGNEPDLYASGSGGNPPDKPGYAVTDFVADFNSFSRAMKAVDNSIKILGPELSWKYPPQTGDNDWLTPFLTGCRGNFDIVSIHRYPFNAEQSTISNAMGDVDSFNTVIQGIRAVMESKGLSGFPLAITEANVSWDGDPAHSTQDASPQTFFAGLWVADTLCAAMEQGLWAMCYWSICEGWTLCFIDADRRQPKPNYYAYQLVSSHMGTTLLQTTPPSGFSAYASRTASHDATVLIAINKNATNNQEDIVFSGLAGAPTGVNEDFPAYSLTCLSIPDNGSPMQVWRYTKAMADQWQPPQQLQ